jgi:predicted CXXCH cytochrome family protein
MGGDLMRSSTSTGGFLKLISLACAFALIAGAPALAQRRPSSVKAPSVTWKAPLRGQPSDYVGADTCAGCHQAEAQEFSKTVHATAAPEAASAASAPAPAANETPSVAAGHKIYDTLKCAGCHKIGGQGGAVGPALGDVGARLSRDELTNWVTKSKPGTVMPTVPAGTPKSEVDELVDFMANLKGQAPAATQTAAGPFVVTGCEACHGPGKAHVEAEAAAAGDPAKVEAGTKLIFKFDANPKENSERCLVCHASGKPQSGFGHSMHMAAGVSCQDCHTPHLVKPAESLAGAKMTPPPMQFVSAQSALFLVPKLPEETRWLHNDLLKEPQPALCFSCHETVRAQFSLPEHHRVPEGFMKCTDCHNPHGSMNHFNLTKANWETCVKCHVEKRGPFVYEHAAVRVEGCAACHTPHGSVNNFLLKRREQRLLCLQCHTVVHVISPSTTTGWNGQANVPHGRGGYQGSGPCTRCHVAVHGSNLDPTLLR